jgi:beta-1,4-mannosyltransferase
VSRPLRVLQSVRGPSRTTNPFVVQLVDAVTAAGADVRWFSWRRGLLGRYDVLHVHWPEVLIRRDGRAARLAARTRFALLLARLTATRTPILRTLHNVGTHERGDRVERWLLGWCDRRTAYWVRLNPHTPLPRPGPGTVIPHGHYTAWYAPHAIGSRIPGRVLTLGLLRPYKGTDALLAAFAGTADPDATLRVVGRPAGAGLRELVTAATAADPRVGAHLDHADDAAVAAEIGAAQLVVLPYRQLHNSGVLLLALSLGRPVLVPDNPVTADLAAEVGPDWVLRFDGELTAEALAKALAATRELPAAGPDLSRREWTLIGAGYVEAYRRAITAARS